MNPHPQPCLDLAPLQGLTQETYHRLYPRFFSGVDRFFMPFIKVQKPTLQPGFKSKNKLPPYDPAHPWVPQILSNTAEEFLVLDAQLHAAGYPVFNWNLGCPVPMVAGKKRGSGLLPFPERIRSILEAIMPRLRCALSVKTRLGFEHPGELAVLMPVFNAFPLAELIIHPRVGKQLYRGGVDLDAFGACLALSRHPVTYNGDVFNRAAFQALRDRFPKVSRWMLGRGVMANPFLPEQINGVTTSGPEKLKRLKGFLDAFAAEHARRLSGPAHLLDKMKELWYYLRFLFPENERFYRRLLRFKQFPDYAEWLNDFFSQGPELAEHLQVVSEDFK